MFLLLAVALGAAPAAHAQISCGDTLGPGGKFEATADIGPCSQDPALTIVGSVKVDFAGHELSCDSTMKNGIEIEGKGAKVENGAVTGCDDAITVGGEGRHKLTRMVARGIEGHGFLLTSDGNKVKECTVADGNDIAIQLMSADKNAITDTHVARIDDNGVQLDESHRNKLKRVSASAVHRGFVVFGDGNKLDDCRVMDTIARGAVVGGDGNRLKEFSAVRVQTGVWLDAGIGNRLTKCRIADASLQGIAVRSGAVGARVEKCQVIGGMYDGIVVESGATGTIVKKNVVLHHDRTDAVDENASCGTNMWTSNTIGTSDPPAGGCVQ